MWQENFKPTCLVPAFSEKSVPSESLLATEEQWGLGTERRAKVSSIQGTQRLRLLGWPVRLCPHWGLHVLACNVLAPLPPSSVSPVCVQYVGRTNRGWIRNARTPKSHPRCSQGMTGHWSFPLSSGLRQHLRSHVWVCSVWKLRSTKSLEPLGVEYSPRVTLAPVTLGENCYIINMTRTRPRIKSIVGICHSISERTQQLLGKLKDENPISAQNSPWIGQNASRLPGKRKTNRLCATYRTSSGPHLSCHCCPDSMPYL